jgi:CheY-like chemotaxis protein
MAAASREPFDLILMDCQMPRMDGFESTRSIRREETARQEGVPAEQAHRMPIIALTANASKEARGQCLDAGMDDYLSKPFDQAQLTAVLARWTPQGQLTNTRTESDPPSWSGPVEVASRRAS